MLYPCPMTATETARAVLRLPMGKRARARLLAATARNRSCRFGSRVIFEALVAFDQRELRPATLVPIAHGAAPEADLDASWIVSSGAGLTRTRATQLARQGIAGACVRIEHPDFAENNRRVGRLKAWDEAGAAIGLWCQARVPAVLVAPVGGPRVCAQLHDLARAWGACRLLLVPSAAEVALSGAEFARRRNAERAFSDYPGVSWIGPTPVHLLGPEASPRFSASLSSALPPAPKVPKPPKPKSTVFGGVVDILERNRS